MSKTPGHLGTLSGATGYGYFEIAHMVEQLSNKQ